MDDGPTIVGPGNNIVALVSPHLGLEHCKIVLGGHVDIVIVVEIVRMGMGVCLRGLQMLMVRGGVGRRRAGVSGIGRARMSVGIADLREIVRIRYGTGWRRGMVIQRRMGSHRKPIPIIGE